MLELNFNPFPTLETPRLILRRMVLEDAPEFFLIRSNSDVMKYIDRPLPVSVTEVEELIAKISDNIDQNACIAWALSLKDKEGFIGTISYHRIEKDHHRAEIGYTLHPQYWKTGLMSEAMQQVLDFGFNTLGFHSIEANVNPGNVASIKLLEKFGFEREAYFKENYFYNGQFLDSAIYGLVNKKLNTTGLPNP